MGTRFILFKYDQWTWSMTELIVATAVCKLIFSAISPWKVMVGSRRSDPWRCITRKHVALTRRKHFIDILHRYSNTGNGDIENWLASVYRQNRKSKTIICQWTKFSPTPWLMLENTHAPWVRFFGGTNLPDRPNEVLMDNLNCHLIVVKWKSCYISKYNIIPGCNI